MASKAVKVFSHHKWHKFSDRVKNHAASPSPRHHIVGLARRIRSDLVFFT